MQAWSGAARLYSQQRRSQSSSGSSSQAAQQLTEAIQINGEWNARQQSWQEKSSSGQRRS